MRLLIFFNFLFKGFSSADKTWLPVADGYENLNVEVQRGTENSHLNVYKALSSLRTEKVFRYGRYESVAFNEGVFAFRRFVTEIYALISLSPSTFSYQWRWKAVQTLITLYTSNQ